MAEQFTSSQNLDIISNEVNKNLLTKPTFTDSKDLTISSPVKKETNILTVPSQSIIDMNNNSLKGFNIVIHNNSQKISEN